MRLAAVFLTETAKFSIKCPMRLFLWAQPGCRRKHTAASCQRYARQTRGDDPEAVVEAYRRRATSRQITVRGNTYPSKAAGSALSESDPCQTHARAGSRAVTRTEALCPAARQAAAACLKKARPPLFPAAFRLAFPAQIPRFYPLTTALTPGSNYRGNFLRMRAGAVAAPRIARDWSPLPVNGIRLMRF
jgi:hypothetical protein